jgi:hypothetical protein
MICERKTESLSWILDMKQFTKLKGNLKAKHRKINNQTQRHYGSERFVQQ